MIHFTFIGVAEPDGFQAGKAQITPRFALEETLGDMPVCALPRRVIEPALRDAQERVIANPCCHWERVFSILCCHWDPPSVGKTACQPVWYVYGADQEPFYRQESACVACRH